ncbi:MAG: integration host factor subunit beta [Phycisphaerales bacterium]|nr:MAG: integration host factor subunit beta [Phycisphaerales bacterium]
MPTITKKDFADRIAENTRAKHVLVKVIVQNFLDEITAELVKGNRLEFRDFGVFEVREQAARTAQNPKTLEPIDVPARRKVKFKMGRIMKEKLNAGVAEQ